MVKTVFMSVANTTDNACDFTVNGLSLHQVTSLELVSFEMDPTVVTDLGQLFTWLKISSPEIRAAPGMDYIFPIGTSVDMNNAVLFRLDQRNVASELIQSLRKYQWPRSSCIQDLTSMRFQLLNADFSTPTPLVAPVSYQFRLIIDDFGFDNTSR